MNDQDPVVAAGEGETLLEPSGLILRPSIPAARYPSDDLPISHVDLIDQLVKSRDWLRRCLRYHLAQAWDFHLQAVIDANVDALTPDVVFNDAHLRYLWLEAEKHKARAHAMADAISAFCCVYAPVVMEEENLAVLGQYVDAYTHWATSVPDEAPAIARRYARKGPQLLGELVRTAQQAADRLADIDDPF